MAERFPEPEEGPYTVTNNPVGEFPHSLDPLQAEVAMLEMFDDIDLPLIWRYQ